MLRKRLPERAWRKHQQAPKPVSGAIGHLSHSTMIHMPPLPVYRPRLLLLGESGMGQEEMGPAVLQALEGCHVATFDLGTLMSDETRSAEAACIQMFVEARRHAPSVLFIPNIHLWSEYQVDGPVTPSVRATFTSLLQGLGPTEPILLLGIGEGEEGELGEVIEGWFEGLGPWNTRTLVEPDTEDRQAYLQGWLEETKSLLVSSRHLPHEKGGKLTDGVNDAVISSPLPTLPRAPTPPPPPPTEAELREQLYLERLTMSRLRHALEDILLMHRKHHKALWDLHLTPCDILTREPRYDLLPQPLDLHGIRLRNFREHRTQGGYRNQGEFLDDLDHFRENALVLLTCRMVEIGEGSLHGSGGGAGMSAQLGQAGRLLDEIISDMDQFPTELWETVAEVSDRLENEKAQWDKQVYGDREIVKAQQEDEEDEEREEGRSIYSRTLGKRRRAGHILCLDDDDDASGETTEVEVEGEREEGDHLGGGKRQRSDQRFPLPVSDVLEDPRIRRGKLYLLGKGRGEEGGREGIKLQGQALNERE